VNSPSPLAGEGRERGRTSQLDPSGKAVGRAQPPHPNPLPQGEMEPEVPSTKGVTAISTVLSLTRCQHFLRSAERRGLETLAEQSSLATRHSPLPLQRGTDGGPRRFTAIVLNVSRRRFGGPAGVERQSPGEPGPRRGGPLIATRFA